MSQTEGYKASQISSMSFDQMMTAVLDIGRPRIQEAIGWRKPNAYTPKIILKDTYNATFQDPRKPLRTVFRRFECQSVDAFKLIDVRVTATNFIFITEASEDVKIRMRRFNVGPGLQTPWEIAEFTLKNLMSGRLNGPEFLEDVLHMHRNWCLGALNVTEIYGDEAAGSW